MGGSLQAGAPKDWPLWTAHLQQVRVAAGNVRGDADQLRL
jgi:hypothetical protein